MLAGVASAKLLGGVIKPKPNIMSDIKKTPTTFLERLDNEHSELNEKVEKLEDFIENNPTFKTVGEMQRVLLVTQLNAMKLYLCTLDERIWDLTPKK